jgi:TolB-like protein/lipoprotein NlpI
MAKPNKLSQFWKELKRRKVINVFIWYAGVAMVLIGLASDVAGPFHLPEGTLRLVIILIIVGFPLAMIFSWFFDFSSQGITKTRKAMYENRFAPITNSIAVLPFQDMSSEKDQEYFCDGITEEIINALVHVGSLKVIARTSAFAFKNQKVDMREIGHRLNVETLLEGSVRKDSNRIRITAQLIKTDDGTHLWSERFDRNLDDIFAIQDEISLSIVDHLKVKLLSEEKSALLKRHTDNFELYDLYLKASHYIKLTTPAAIEKAVDYIEQVLRRDPQFILGYNALGIVNMVGSFFGNLPPNIGYPKAKECAKKIREVDSNAPEIPCFMSAFSLYYDWDWDNSEQHFKHALQLNPNYEWPHHNYSWFLVFSGRYSEAILEAKRTLELDPLSGFFHAELGHKYIYTGRFEPAIDHLKQSIEKFPNSYLGHWYLGLAYICVGMMEEAVEKSRKAVELSGGIPLVVSTLAIALFMTGRTEEAESLMMELVKKSENEYVSAGCFIGYYRIKGEQEKVDKWVERAIREHDGYFPFLLFHPIKESRLHLDEQKYPYLIKMIGLKKHFEIVQDFTR